MVFSRDGRLAVTVQSALTENSLLLIDPAAGTTLAQTSLPFAPSWLSPGPASTLVVYGQAEGDVAGISPPPAPRVLLLDGATLEPVWETTLDELSSGHWCAADCDAGHGVQKMVSHVPGVALSPGGERLLIVHANEDRLTTIDLVRRSVRTVDIAQATAWIERLLALTAGVAHAKGPMDALSRHVALSPDGARLYAGGYDMLMVEDGAGGWTMNEEMQPLRLIDPATGRILAESDVANHLLQLTPDGRQLLALDLSNNATVTTVLDAETLAFVTRVEGHHVVPVADLDGQTQFIAQSLRHHRTDFTLFDPLSFTVAAKWPADGPAWLAAK
jgi:DNA-binding beta-propeller fold protein YncE